MLTTFMFEICSHHCFQHCALSLEQMLWFVKSCACSVFDKLSRCIHICGDVLMLQQPNEQQFSFQDIRLIQLQLSRLSNIARFREPIDLKYIWCKSRYQTPTFLYWLLIWKNITNISIATQWKGIVETQQEMGHIKHMNHPRL